MNELEVDACIIEANRKLMKLCLIAAGQCHRERARRKISRRRLTCCVNQLRCLGPERKVTSDDTVVTERIRFRAVSQSEQHIAI